MFTLMKAIFSIQANIWKLLMGIQTNKLFSAKKKDYYVGAESASSPSEISYLCLATGNRVEPPLYSNKTLSMH